MTLHDRLALAVCRSMDDPGPCHEACPNCRRHAFAVAYELADWLQERFGHSEAAGLIRGSVPDAADGEVQP